ncbi:MAG TPA: tetratricopeptide repeat protein [Acidimicrobiales bacterium]|nr:tetratricopeptide repeat protein [Acidimicrobiales bacterium]
MEEIERTLAERDYDRAERLIFRAAMDFVAGTPAPRVDADALEAWVDALGEAAPDRVWIAYYQAWVAHSSGQPTLAYMLMQRAARYVEMRAAQMDADDGERRRWRSTVNVALAMTAMAAGQPADIPAAFAAARDALGIPGPQHPTVVTPEEAARWREKDPLGAMTFWLEIAAITEALAEFEALAAALNNLSLFALERGEPIAARRLATQSCELRRSRGPRYSFATSLNSLGMAERVAGDLNAARDDLLEARAVALSCGNAQAAAYALSNLAEVCADAGDFDAATDAFERSSREKEAMADTFGLAWGWRAWARALRLRGRAPEALELATRAFELRQTSFDPNERTLLLVELAACLAANGNGEAAAARLGEADLFVDLFDLKATRAAMLVQRSRVSDDATLLNEAEHLAAQYGLFALDQEFRTASQRHSAKPTFTARFIGEFRLEIGDRVLDPSQWKSRRAAEILRILSLHAGRPVHGDKLLEWVWPAEGPSAKPSLNAAISTIRRALESIGAGRELLARDGERYALVGFAGSDVQDFETLVTRARTAEGSGRDVLASALLEHALERWRGTEFLPADRYAEWAASERGRIEELVAVTREHAAELLLEQGQYEEALVVVQEALVASAARESAYRLLIRVHLARDDRGSAQRALADCTAALDAELGVPPSRSTTDLLRDS